jgi:mono/diheme cytochrome c family protein
MTRHQSPMAERVKAEVLNKDHQVKLWLLIISVATLLVLLVAAVKENLLGEWRSYQREYGDLLYERAEADWEVALADDFRVHMRQVVVPELDTFDRCISCHTGIDNPSMADVALPFRSHPGDLHEWHDVEKVGCTVCHDGQGRGITEWSAHGEDPHWEAPLRTGAEVYTNCSRCHLENDLYGGEADLFSRSEYPAPLDEGELHASIPGFDSAAARAVVRGKRLTLREGCLGCHAYRGRGGSLGPAITTVGDEKPHHFSFAHVEGDHTVFQWMVEHFQEPERISPNTLMPELELDDEEAAALALYMMSLHHKGLPAAYTPDSDRRSGKPVTGRELYAMYCKSCHGSEGQGSTLRQPDEMLVAEVPSDLMVPSLNNPDTLAVASENYMTAILEHGRPGTSMIAWGSASGGGLRPEEVARVVDYVASWQPAHPQAPDLASAVGEADMGRFVYDRSCAACHGVDAEGGIGVSLNTPSFQALASTHFLQETIIEGRPDSGMPGWRQLDAQRVADLVAWLRAWHPLQSDEREALSLASGGRPAGTDTASAQIGGFIYDERCAACHGDQGQGEIAPTLASPDFLALADDHYLYVAMVDGRPGAGMPAWRNLSSADVASTIQHLRSWQETPSRRLSTATIDGDAATGREVFTGNCVGCHGDHAEGAVGPQLNNPVFLATVSDAMIRSWVLDGRSGTAMRGFARGGQGMTELDPERVDDVVAWLRSLEGQPRVEVSKHPTGNPGPGAVVFEQSCSGCHGVFGEGDTGPALANGDFLELASDGFILGTMSIGRDGTEMRPVRKSPQSIVDLTVEQLEDVLARLRAWEQEPPGLADSHRFVVPWDLARGGQLFVSNCAGCHGVEGRAEFDEPGKASAWAPALNNQGFLAAATDGFLQATIINGRVNTAMRAFGDGTQGLVDLPAADVDHIVSYIRSWSRQPDVPTTILATRPPGDGQPAE